MTKYSTSPTKMTRFYYIFILFIFLPFIPVSAQCPQVNLESIEITVDLSVKQIVVRNQGDEGFENFGISIYNMDNKSYYYDSERSKSILEIQELSVNINNTRIEINNITSGDFVIILENSGCEKQVIGWGYSGLPHSGIRIQE